MAEVVTETLINQKLETGWNRKDVVDNFVAEGEITVTITLSEYRRLVTSDATKQKEIEDANANKWERESENNKLKEKVKELDRQLFEYRVKFGELSTEESESE